MFHLYFDTCTNRFNFFYHFFSCYSDCLYECYIFIFFDRTTPMSQFDRGSKKPKMDPVEITALPDLSPYVDHNNLTITVRVGWVQENINPTQKSRAQGVFSAVLVGQTGLADISVWDPQMIKEWQKVARDGGSIVKITGLSCAKRSLTSGDFARSPSEYVLHANAGRYLITVMKGKDDPSYPKNGTTPQAWLRSATSISATPPSPSHARGDSITSVAKTCCDAPGDMTCKRTGALHQAVCFVCRRVIKEDQPFCSKQTGMVKCAPHVAGSLPPSPFKEDFTHACDADAPPPKVLKFTKDDDTEEEDPFQQPGHNVKF